MKFKVGDEVKLGTNGMSVLEKYGLTGKIATIKYIESDRNYPYTLKGVDFCWCDEELELVKEETKVLSEAKFKITLELLKEKLVTIQMIESDAKKLMSALNCHSCCKWIGEDGEVLKGLYYSLSNSMNEEG